MLAAWQALDLFHAAQELAAGLVRRLDSYRLGDLEQFLNGNIERDGEANRRLRKESRLAVFIVGAMGGHDTYSQQFQQLSGGKMA